MQEIYDKYPNLTSRKSFENRYNFEIISNDGIEIPAVKLILELISPVFAEHFLEYNAANVINIDSDAETIFLMLEAVYTIFNGGEIVWDQFRHVSLMKIRFFVFEYDIAILNGPILRALHSFLEQLSYFNDRTEKKEIVGYIVHGAKDKEFIEVMCKFLKREEKRFGMAIKAFIDAIWDFTPVEHRLESIEKVRLNVIDLIDSNENWASKIESHVEYCVNANVTMPESFKKHIFKQSHRGIKKYSQFIKKANLCEEYINYLAN